METLKQFEHCLLLRVAVVAQGYRCLSVMRMLNEIKPGRLRLHLVAIATGTKSIACSKFAGEVDIEVYEDHMDLLSLRHLDLILEMTGDPKTLSDLVKNKSPSVGILDRQASMLFFDIAALYQQGSDPDSEISLATSFASALLEASPDAVMVIDRDFRIITCNESPYITGGKDRDWAIGKFCFEAIHNNHASCTTHDLKCPVEEVLKTGRPARSLHEIEHGCGEGRLHQSTAYPLTNLLGEIVQIVVVIRDITNDLIDKVEQRTKIIKTDLERFAREDRLVSLGRLVTSVCHEINNPISSILTFNKLILRCLRENELPKEGITGFERYLDVSVKEAMRCGQIVKNLLTFARHKSIEVRQIDLNEMIRTIIILVKYQLEMIGIELEQHIPDPPFTAKGDYTQIQQCLMNLVFNAIESMTQGDKLIITGGRNNENKTIWLTVADSGCGIAPEDISRIFEPFYTSKKDGKGVGLGLSMVYGIIRDHGGSVEVESEPGKGSAFKIVLPSGVETSEPTQREAT